MLNQEFCEHLAYEITRTMSSSIESSLKTYWCDGILLPTNERDYSLKTINDKRKVELTAYFGRNEQEKYALTVYFGSKSLSRYARQLDIENCIPETGDWLTIDTETKTISVELL